MSETQSFSRLLPKETRFITGENPSPIKLSASFNQIENAFYTVESFLGNGIDYHVTDQNNKKMLFNLSSAIGRTDKLYKPINLVPSLDFINRTWGGDATIYSSDTLEFVTDTLFIGIPVNAYNTYEFGIYYIGDGKVMGLDGTTTWIDLPTNSEYGWHTISVTSNIGFFKISMKSGSTTFNIKSLYVCDKTIYNGIYNKAYCLPLDNTTYWTAKTPCKYSNPQGTQVCTVRTCDYCIGQQYNMDYTNSVTFGSPKCVSLDNDPINGAFWNNSGTSVSIEYTTDDTTQRIQYITLQSPLNSVNNQYALSFKPFHVHNLDKDTEIPSNASVIYDTKNSSSTVKHLTSLYSAGGNTDIRSDIVYIKDKTEINDGIGDPKRYIVIGGNYGLIDLMYDLMKFVNLPVPVDASNHTAVYAG